MILTVKVLRRATEVRPKISASSFRKDLSVDRFAVSVANDRDAGNNRVQHPSRVRQKRALRPFSPDRKLPSPIIDGLPAGCKAKRKVFMVERLHSEATRSHKENTEAVTSMQRSSVRVTTTEASSSASAGEGKDNRNNRVMEDLVSPGLALG